MLTRALLMTSSHSEGPAGGGPGGFDMEAMMKQMGGGGGPGGGGQPDMAEMMKMMGGMVRRLTPAFLLRG